MSNVRQTSREVFDFFRLPRELLNASYDLDDVAGYCDLPSPVEQYEAISLRTRVPLTNLLLVNRQLNNEYTDRCKSIKTVVTRETALDRYQGITAHSKACDAVHLELYLLIRPCADHELDGSADPLSLSRWDVKMYLGWIPGLIAQMSSLRSVHVLLHLHRTRAFKQCYNTLLEDLVQLEAIEKVDQLEIRLCQGEGDRSATDGPSVRLASWTRCSDILSTCPDNLRYYNLQSESDSGIELGDDASQRTHGSEEEDASGEVDAG